jgi:hypothetical protein
VSAGVITLFTYWFVMMISNGVFTVLKRKEGAFELKFYETINGVDGSFQLKFHEIINAVERRTCVWWLVAQTDINIGMLINKYIYICI